jgi:hypothetical protein
MLFSVSTAAATSVQPEGIRGNGPSLFGVSAPFDLDPNRRLIDFDTERGMSICGKPIPDSTDEDSIPGAAAPNPTDHAG